MGHYGSLQDWERVLFLKDLMLLGECCSLLLSRCFCWWRRFGPCIMQTCVVTHSKEEREGQRSYKVFFMFLFFSCLVIKCIYLAYISDISPLKLLSLIGSVNSMSTLCRKVFRSSLLDFLFISPPFFKYLPPVPFFKNGFVSVSFTGRLFYSFWVP